MNEKYKNQLKNKNKNNALFFVHLIKIHTSNHDKCVLAKLGILSVDVEQNEYLSYTKNLHLMYR